MLTNSSNKKILKYLKAMKLKILEDNFSNYLKKGNTLENTSKDILLNSIKFKDHQKFLTDFKKIISSASSEQKTTENNINKNSSAIRVKKYRKNTKAKGYKNLSLLLPPGTHQKLKDLKLKNNMTYAELITFLAFNQK